MNLEPDDEHSEMYILVQPQIISFATWGKWANPRLAPPPEGSAWVSSPCRSRWFADPWRPCSPAGVTCGQVGLNRQPEEGVPRRRGWGFRLRGVAPAEASVAECAVNRGCPCVNTPVGRGCRRGTRLKWGSFSRSSMRLLGDLGVEVEWSDSSVRKLPCQWYREGIGGAAGWGPWEAWPGHVGPGGAAWAGSGGKGWEGRTPRRARDPGLVWLWCVGQLD